MYDSGVVGEDRRFDNLDDREGQQQRFAGGQTTGRWHSVTSLPGHVAKEVVGVDSAFRDYSGKEGALINAVDVKLEALAGIREGATILGVKEATLRGWLRQTPPPFPVFRFGGRTIRFRLSDLKAFIDRQSEEAAAKA